MSAMLSDSKAKEFSQAFNTLREQYSKLGVDFSAKEISTLMKNAGLPASNGYVFQYIKAGMFIPQTRGKYSFPEQPVHFRRIQDAITAVRRSISKYGKKHTAKMREMRNPSEETLKAKEKEAIEFLKSRGYRILAAETRWYEC